METASTPKNPTLSERFDSLIKSAGLIVGIVSAVITIYVALTTYEINQRIGKAQADNVERDRTIKDALIEREQHENASRLVHEFGATNAKGFALGYLQEKTKYEWLDLQLRSNIESYVELWKQGRHLMTGSREDGILLRQVAWIRIANIGKRTADNVRISALVRDFSNEKGQASLTIDKLAVKHDGWVEKEFPIANLVEPSSATTGMRTSTTLPLFHVSGAAHYFGRAIIPTKITWYDPMSKTTRTIAIDYDRESLLLNSMGSAVLGRIAQ